MAIKHEVWARPHGKRLKRFATFTIERWQYAMKLAAHLQDKGYEDVQVRDVGTAKAKP
jgi:hypothetical protein